MKYLTDTFKKKIIVPFKLKDMSTVISNVAAKALQDEKVHNLLACRE